jgi:hypothetical protein
VYNHIGLSWRASTLQQCHRRHSPGPTFVTALGAIQYVVGGGFPKFIRYFIDILGLDFLFVKLFIRFERNFNFFSKKA